MCLVVVGHGHVLVVAFVSSHDSGRFGVGINVLVVTRSRTIQSYFFFSFIQGTKIVTCDLEVGSVKNIIWVQTGSNVKLSAYKVFQ